MACAGYYTVSEENGNKWDLFQDAVEGAVFLGNRGGRRRFTAGFSSQGPALTSPLHLSDRQKLLNHQKDLESYHTNVKKEIKDLEKAGHVYSCDMKLKALKKKKLALKDRLTSLAALLEKERQSRDPHTAQTVTKTPKRLGEGACGSVVLGRCMSSGEEVAIKFEPVVAGEASRLAHEFQVLRSLKGVTGFPSPRYFGTQSIMGKECDFMVGLGSRVPAPPLWLHPYVYEYL